MGKFKKIIKIPNKESFEDLSLYEIGLMIEADSALSPEGNELFDSCALDEFLHFRRFDTSPQLQKIQSYILANIYLEIPGSKNKGINTAFLKAYAKELKNENSAL
ncbi:MAG: hypothetical protein P8098_05445 [Candidatus Thiodiazotropha sp.]